MVSGRYFFPNAPVLCLKWMPAWAVTSVNSIGPDRWAGAVGVGGVDGTEAGAGGEELTADCGEVVCRRFAGCCLQPASSKTASSVRQQVTRIIAIGILKLPRTTWGQPPRLSGEATLRRF